MNDAYCKRAFLFILSSSSRRKGNVHPVFKRCSPPNVNAIHFLFLAVLLHVVSAYTLMSSLHLLLCLPPFRFPVFGCQSIILVVHLLSFLRAVCPTHLHLACFIVLMVSLNYSRFRSYFCAFNPVSNWDMKHFCLNHSGTKIHSMTNKQTNKLNKQIISTFCHQTIAT